jgi:D-serine deaminase-like pyridoxal phosphate-dependent protein
MVSPALASLPPPPKSLTATARDKYRRLGKLLIDAGTLAATDVPMLEDLARVDATIDELYADPSASRATLAAYHRLSKEIKAQLGMSSSARKAVQKLGQPDDPDTERLRGLL